MPKLLTRLYITIPALFRGLAHVALSACSFRLATTQGTSPVSAGCGSPGGRSETGAPAGKSPRGRSGLDRRGMSRSRSFADVAFDAGCFGLQETFLACPGVIRLHSGGSWCGTPAGETGETSSRCGILGRNLCNRAG